jgi:1,4-alpha-glucan branching enzyme
VQYWGVKWIVSVVVLSLMVGAGWGWAQPGGEDENYPRRTEGGVEFRFFAPEARAVYIAGSFNDWADNEDGVITSDSARMTGPDTFGIWTRTMSLPAGRHTLKFCIDGDPDRWVTPLWALEKDGEDNAVIYVTPGGLVLFRSDKNENWKPEVTPDGVIFRVYRPGAENVFLAGDFNNWAENNEGLVTAPQFAMEDTDKDGVWEKKVALESGTHAYQFVVDGNSWEPDPNVKQRDGENHSVIKVEASYR